jgi:hypothetical protein
MEVGTVQKFLEGRVNDGVEVGEGELVCVSGRSGIRVWFGGGGCEASVSVG